MICLRVALQDTGCARGHHRHSHRVRGRRAAWLQQRGGRRRQQALRSLPCDMVSLGGVWWSRAACASASVAACHFSYLHRHPQCFTQVLRRRAATPTGSRATAGAACAQRCGRRARRSVSWRRQDRQRRRWQGRVGQRRRPSILNPKGLSGLGAEPHPHCTACLRRATCMHTFTSHTIHICLFRKQAASVSLTSCAFPARACCTRSKTIAPWHLPGVHPRCASQRAASNVASGERVTMGQHLHAGMKKQSQRVTTSCMQHSACCSTGGARMRMRGGSTMAGGKRGPGVRLGCTLGFGSGGTLSNAFITTTGEPARFLTVAAAARGAGVSVSGPLRGRSMAAPSASARCWAPPRRCSAPACSCRGEGGGHGKGEGTSTQEGMHVRP